MKKFQIRIGIEEIEVNKDGDHEDSWELEGEINTIGSEFNTLKKAQNLKNKIVTHGNNMAKTLCPGCGWILAYDGRVCVQPECNYVKLPETFLEKEVLKRGYF